MGGWGWWQLRPREGGLRIGVAQHISGGSGLGGGVGGKKWEMGAVVGDRVGVRGLCSIGALPNGTLSLTSLPTVVATTLKNANASLVYSFLYKTVEVGSGLPLASWSVCQPGLFVHLFQDTSFLRCSA